MFRNTIISTEFATTEANTALSSKIPYNSYGGDVSLVSTLRAIMPKRMADDDSITVKILASMSTRAPDTMKNFIVANLEVQRTLYIVPIRKGTVEENTMENAMHAIEGSRCVYIKPVTTFFEKAFGVWVVANELNKSSMVFVEDLDTRKWHYIQCSVLSWMPWYFNPKGGDTISEDEHALLSSLCEKTPDKYIETINKMASEYNFDKLKIHNAVSSIFHDNRNSLISSVKHDIQVHRDNIKNYFRSISELQKTINGLLVRLCGLENHDDTSDLEEELEKYLSVKKDIYIESYNDGEMYMTITAPLNIYSVDAAKKNMYQIAKNKSQYAGNVSFEDMCVLLNALFVTNDLHMDFCARYRMNVLNSYVEGRSRETFDTARYRGYMPNPHIYYHACMGGYQNDITECLCEGDYIGAFESLIASCGSLNWTDYTVTSEFVEDLYSKNKKWIKNNDGVYMTASDSIEYLKTIGKYDAIHQDIINEI